jgi:hypothetical protein
MWPWQADAGALSPMKMSFDAPPQSYSPATGSKVSY